MGSAGTPPLAVIKVGGSLLELPDLGRRLQSFLNGLRSCRVLLVPGGGKAADQVRDWDRMHRLGEETSHWLALRAATMNGWLLRALMPGSRVVRAPDDTPANATGILDLFRFAESDDVSPGRLPHMWAVTTDSVAVRAAIVGRATRLVLLKSCDLPTDHRWEAAAHAGLIDPVFPGLVQDASLEVTWVNLRALE